MTRFRCNVCGFGSNDPSRFFEHTDKHPAKPYGPSGLNENSAPVLHLNRSGEPWNGEDESLIAQMEASS